DPQEIGRELAWLAYVTRSRTQALDALRATLDRLAGLRQQTDDSRRELDAVRADVRKRREDLQDQQAQRREVLEKIRARLDEEREGIRARRGEGGGDAKRLQARGAGRGDLIEGLEAEIARAEARRQAALKAEGERRAREQAERARAEEARREQERARGAEQARRIREQAEHHVQEEQPAPQQPDEAGQAETQAPPPKEPQPGGAAAARIEPEGGFPGLNKGLPHPVAGQVQGRFGTQRPEGGLWRGIVLRAPAGTPVRAVAPGRVVYAHWLSGFGNLLIIDHGKQYLSIYAYNQSL